MGFPLQHGQAVVMRSDASLEKRIAVEQQVVSSNGGGNLVRCARHEFHRLLCGDVFEYDFQTRKRWVMGISTWFIKTFSLSNTSTSGSVTSPCTSNGIPISSMVSKRPVAPGDIGDTCGGIRGGASRIIFHSHVLRHLLSPRQFLKGASIVGKV